VPEFVLSDEPGIVVKKLIEESKFFIEWTAPDAELGIQTQLVELQIKLACWQSQWNRIWPDLQHRARVRHEAVDLSDRVLAMSGLLG